MIDLRAYKETVVAAVAREREADKNWSWSLKAVNKTVIRIGWGYLDYIGEKAPFTVEASEEDDGKVIVIGTIPNGRKIYWLVDPKNCQCYGTIKEAIAGVIHRMACSAHNTY